MLYYLHVRIMHDQMLLKWELTEFDGVCVCNYNSRSQLNCHAGTAMRMKIKKYTLN